MKLLNYDNRELIMKNVKFVKREVPSTFTKRQYQILCNLIRQKKISKSFFEFLLMQLYDTREWKSLNYSQMYQLIHILTFYNYQKEGTCYE